MGRRLFSDLLRTLVAEQATTARGARGGARRRRRLAEIRKNPAAFFSLRVRAERAARRRGGDRGAAARQFLNNLHAVALSHVLRRPVHLRRGRGHGRVRRRVRRRASRPAVDGAPRPRAGRHPKRIGPPPSPRLRSLGAAFALAAPRVALRSRPRGRSRSRGTPRGMTTLCPWSRRRRAAARADARRARRARDRRAALRRGPVRRRPALGAVDGGATGLLGDPFAPDAAAAARWPPAAARRPAVPRARPVARCARSRTRTARSSRRARAARCRAPRVRAARRGAPEGQIARSAAPAPVPKRPRRLKAAKPALWTRIRRKPRSRRATGRRPGYVETRPPRARDPLLSPGF